VLAGLWRSPRPSLSVITFRMAVGAPRARYVFRRMLRAVVVPHALTGVMKQSPRSARLVGRQSARPDADRVYNGVVRAQNSRVDEHWPAGQQRAEAGGSR
jgi:hypothetical protein